jgi:hypothetical protein
MDAKYREYRKVIFDGVKSVSQSIDIIASDLAKAVTPKIN